MFLIDKTRTELWGKLCDDCIQGYKYEPQYKFLFNEDGSKARNEKTGAPIYKLDDKERKFFKDMLVIPLWIAGPLF
jgi:hypothetical protein